MATPISIDEDATKADRLKGSESGETLRGLGGNDFIWGFGGDDKLWGGADRDVLYGGAGNDELHGGGDRDVLYGGDGNDELRGGAGNDVLYGGPGIDELHGDGGNDVLIDKEQRGWGNGALRGGAGDDVLIAAGGHMYGEAGNDILIATGGAQAWGGPGADTLIGPGSGNVMYIDSDAGVTVNLADGTASGGHAEFTDPITGVKSYDTISGFTGIVGSRHDDTLTGDEKDNFFRGLGGADHFVGGEGTDTVYYGGKNGRDGVTVDLDAGTARGGHATVKDSDGMVLRSDTLDGIENLIGSNYADKLMGNGEANSLSGQDGNDVLEGRGGMDSLGGGKGADTLNGGSGADHLSGHDGADTFVFGGESIVTTPEALPGETDKVHDFSGLGADGVKQESEHGDKLDLSGLKTAKGLTRLDFIEDRVFSAPGAQSKVGEVRYEQKGEDTSTTEDDFTHVTADINGDGNADFQVTLEGLHTLTGADVILA